MGKEMSVPTWEIVIVIAALAVPGPAARLSPALPAGDRAESEDLRG